ncbi:peptide ABC transporter substrate-binding protein [Kocuria turfanensis]|uniref:Peptide ABC transporter substrate-binding protein n=2 Tax=Kocuria turfanensis TaxID=388357 RepID=A0A512II25_9MICC|nr:peptide ABC transporter substrate-binding protein [Kocuria turfanensis]
MPRGPFSHRPRGDAHYMKPALSHVQLVEQLAERGLEIPDADRAIRYLRHIGYYRLSPYTIPYQIHDGSHQFHPGTTFDDVLGLYVFDRQLRLLVLDAVERVEVAVRASLTDIMATSAGGPHWYVDPRHFGDAQKHRRLLDEIREQCSQQLRRQAEPTGDPVTHRSALEHYLTTYATPELPPSWVMVEMLTIGQLSHLYSNLRPRHARTAIAHSLGLNEAVLSSWLKTYVRVRNVCAHHGRLWNVGLGVYPAIPADASVAWLTDRAVFDEDENRRKRLYPVLVSLQSVLTTVSPRSSWSQRLVQLLEQHPHVPLRAMGLFHGWANDPFWTAPLAPLANSPAESHNLVPRG